MDQRELGLSLIWRPFSFWLSVVSSETLGKLKVISGVFVE
jgi:hypothetical protein